MIALVAEGESQAVFCSTSASIEEQNQSISAFFMVLTDLFADLLHDSCEVLTICINDSCYLVRGKSKGLDALIKLFCPLCCLWHVVILEFATKVTHIILMGIVTLRKLRLFSELIVVNVGDYNANAIIRLEEIAHHP